MERVSSMWNKMSIRSIPDQFSRLNTVGQMGVGLLGVYGSYVGAKVVYGMYKHLANGKIRRKKQQENAQSIKDLAERLKSDPLPLDRAVFITSLSLSELRSELKEGKIRPIEALKAYQTKALDVHGKTNCLVEVIKEAEELALELEKSPREGTLWGVPISIKDDVGIKGYDSTIGLVIKVGKPSPDDAELLKALCKEGAIPFVKTNVPQTEMSFEPGNPINGVVHNPHRHGYGPGGSSSGEGALIGSGGSLLGIGSDLGGSIRVPAHFCGVFGFKPTSERVSTRGMSLDQEVASMSIRAVWGPLSRDMEGVETVMKVLWEGGEMAKADPECVPMGFDTKEYTSEKKLRIGYYLENGIVPTFSACVRATEKAKRVLADMGHEVDGGDSIHVHDADFCADLMPKHPLGVPVGFTCADPRCTHGKLVPWQPQEPAYNYSLSGRIFSADGGEGMRKELRYDIIHPTISPFSRGLFTPICIKKLLSYLIYPFNAAVASQMYASCGAGNVAANAELDYELWTQRRVLQDSWNAAGLDAVICPPQAIVAPPLGSGQFLFDTCLFTLTYNLLHFPAGVVPVTTVLQSDVDQLQKDFPSGNKNNDLIRCAMSDTVDLPVGVMVASARYHDETCLRVMKVLAEGLQKSQ